MLLHPSHGNVGEVTNSHTLASLNAHNASNIELLEYPSYDNSLQSSSAVTDRNPKRSTSRESFYVKFWARITNSFVDWWIGELLAILLSIIAFFAIVFTLRKYDDHTLPRLPRNVPLNFVVSTLATVSKSSLLLAVASAFGQFKWLWMSSKQRRLQDLQVFDEASRGPLGAFKLLISRKGFSWASIGAIVTILCLIFDPFIQGMMSISERVVYKDNPTSLLKRAENYPSLPDGTRSTGVILNYPLINAINDAVFNPHPLLETQPRCPTGNCTWPPFTSLGFCSKCEDISQSLRNSSTYFDNQCSSSDCFDTEPLRNYTYRFPELNGQVLRTRNRSLSISFILAERVPTFLVIKLDWNSTKAFNFTDGTSVPTVALVTLIRISTQPYDYGGVLAASLCALSFCAQRRKVSVSLGLLSSTILQTVYGAFESSGGGHIKGLSFTGDNFNMTFPSNMIYDDLSYYDMEEFLQVIIGSLIGNLSVALNQIYTRANGVVTPYFGDPLVTSNIIGGFNASSNISMTMDNIATTLTNWARDSSNITVAGQSGQAEFYVHVSWPWITLPAFLIIAGTMFLILVMFETKRLGAPIWKTSELALLFHGLEESDQESNGLLSSSEMVHMASSTTAKVTKTSGGRWMLRQERIPIKST